MTTKAELEKQLLSVAATLESERATYRAMEQAYTNLQESHRDLAGRLHTTEAAARKNAVLEACLRFQRAIQPLNLELKVTFVGHEGAGGAPIDLDVECRCWCPNHKKSDGGNPNHVTGINANFENILDRLRSLKDQVERYTGCLVDYV